jgi:hypothetical protein
METPSLEEKIPLSISPKNVPLVTSALNSEIDHLKKIQKACIKKKQFQAANDLAPGIALLEKMVQFLKSPRPVTLPLIK